MSSSLSFNFILLLLSLIFLSHHHITYLFILWTYKHVNKKHRRHCPCFLLTPLSVTKNLKAMAKGTETTYIFISNPLCYFNYLCMLSHFRNVPVDTIASAFVVVVLLTRLFLVLRVKKFSVRKKLITIFLFWAVKDK